MKSRVRLTESDLHRIVKESVNRIVEESNGNNTIDSESYSQKGAFFDDEFNKGDDYIVKYYNALDKAYHSISYIESLLGKTIPKDKIQYVNRQFPYANRQPEQSRFGKYSHISHLMYTAGAAVRRAREEIAGALREMEKYHYIK